MAKRDEVALAELYDRFASRLLGLLSRILPERSAAEDVLQEIFLRVWSEARRYDRGDVSLSARLVFMSRQRAVEKRRAERKLPPLTRGRLDPLEKSASWLPRPEEIALVEERQKLLKKVVNQLPKPQRQILELAVFEGYAEKEIAQKVGQPLGRVKRELRAAMTFLRHRLGAVLGTWAANI